VLAALALALTACTSGGGTGTTTPTPSPTVAAACPYGDWHSTQVTASGDAAGATFSLQGGSDVTLALAPDGAVNADFTPMQPITFTAQVAATEARGEFRYIGPVTGILNVTSSNPATATPTGGTGTTGPWQPVGQVNFADLRATVKVTAPVNAMIADNVKLGDITGNQSTQIGNAVDLQPLLRAGQYTCNGDQLTVALSSGTAPTVTWTFARA
jgi:hypothetical protein